MPDREEVLEGLEKVWNAFNVMEHELYADYVFDAMRLIKCQEPKLQCKECQRWDCEGCPIKDGDV